MVEREAQPHRDVRVHALRGEQEVARLAGHGSERELRERDDGRPMQHGAQRVRELRVPDRLGRGRVHRPADLGLERHEAQHA